MQDSTYAADVIAQCRRARARIRATVATVRRKGVLSIWKDSVLNREETRTLEHARVLFPGVEQEEIERLQAEEPHVPVSAHRFIVQSVLVELVLESRRRYLESLPAVTVEPQACVPMRRRSAPRRRGAGRPGARRVVRTGSRGDPDHLAEPPGAPGPSTEGGGS